MKILNIFPSYEPAWAFGGVVRCASNLCRAMAIAGADISVFTTNVDGQGGLLPVPLGKPVNLGGVRVTYFPSTFGKNSVWDSRALLRSLNREIDDYDVVYVSAIWQWIGISTGRLARKHGLPYVVGTHGSFDVELFKKRKIQKTMWWHLFLKNNFRHADAIHMTTEYERHQATRLRSENTSFIVPNCVPLDAFEMNADLGEKIRSELRISAGAPLLLTVGRPDPKKRLDVTLDSFQIVHQACPDARLMIVGPYDNDYGLRMKRKSNAMKASDSIIWTGYRTGDALKGCFAAADLFLLPSIDENFGMVVAEAMAAGVPVIVSEHVGVADDVQRRGAGIVTRPEVREFARAVLDLLSDREHMWTMGKKGREAALALYSGQQVVRLMLQALEDVVSGKRSEECAWG